MKSSLAWTALVGLVAGFAAVSPASAQDGSTLYGELGFARVALADGPDFAFSTLYGRGGVQFNKYLGAEVEGGMGAGRDSATVSGFRVNAKLNWTAGAFGVASLPLSDRSQLVFRAGYAGAELEADAGFGAVSETASGAAGGIGYRRHPGAGGVGWRVDYTHYELNDSGTDAVSISIVGKF